MTRLSTKYQWLMAAIMLSLAALTSCSESNEDEEFVDWKATNERTFAAIYANASSQNGDPNADWRTYSVYSKTGEVASAMEDNIAVRIINRGKNSGSPLFTDTVSIHYRGRLLPSTTYTEGYIFDSTWSNEYNLETMTPFESLPVSNFVDGFSTALQHMQIGDRWEIYIPWQLAYGAKGTTTGNIPGYSMLIFDVTLVGYRR